MSPSMPSPTTSHRSPSKPKGLEPAGGEARERAHREHRSATRETRQVMMAAMNHQSTGFQHARNTNYSMELIGITRNY